MKGLYSAKELYSICSKLEKLAMIMGGMLFIGVMVAIFLPW